MSLASSLLQNRNLTSTFSTYMNGGFPTRMLAVGPALCAFFREGQAQHCLCRRCSQFEFARQRSLDADTFAHA